MLNSAAVMNTTRWSGFLSSVSASRPKRSCHVTCPGDSSLSNVGKKNVQTEASTHITAPLYPASAELSAFSALTSQQPDIQPKVAMARIVPNSFCASANRENTMVDARLKVGDEHSAWIWMSASTSQGFQPSLIAVLTTAIAAAVANDSPRSTFTGEAWRSA